MADESRPIKQNEIEELLKQAKAAKPAAAGGSAPAAPPAAAASAEDGGAMGQNDIEKLLAGKSGGKPAAAPAVKAPATAARPAAVTSETDGSGIAAADLDLLLNQAEQALASLHQSGDALPPGVKPFDLQSLQGASPSSEFATLDLIRDVELDLRIEFGRTQMYIEDVLKLRKGAVVPLDKLAGDPVDIFVNGRLIARGEVLVLNDNFCVRIAELIAGEVALAG
jgi:flagellar motor switch protein FliN